MKIVCILHIYCFVIFIFMKFCLKSLLKKFIVILKILLYYYIIIKLLNQYYEIIIKAVAQW